MDDDNIPLAQLYPTLNGQNRSDGQVPSISRSMASDVTLHVPPGGDEPPAYSPSEPPPPYAPKSQALPPPHSHKLACMIVSFDLVRRESLQLVCLGHESYIDICQPWNLLFKC